MRNAIHRPQRRGLTLLASLLGASIASFLALSISQMISYAQKGNRHIAYSSDRLQILRDIGSQFVNGNTCSGIFRNEYGELADFDPNRSPTSDIHEFRVGSSTLFRVGEPVQDSGLRISKLTFEEIDVAARTSDPIAGTDSYFVKLMVDIEKTRDHDSLGGARYPRKEFRVYLTVNRTTKEILDCYKERIRTPICRSVERQFCNSTFSPVSRLYDDAGSKQILADIINPCRYQNPGLGGAPNYPSLDLPEPSTPGWRLDDHESSASLSCNPDEYATSCNLRYRRISYVLDIDTGGYNHFSQTWNHAQGDLDFASASCSVDMDNSSGQTVSWVKMSLTCCH